MTFPLGNLRGTPAYTELAVKCRAVSVMFSPRPDLKISGGSGTLVRYKSLCGILSATHVMAHHIDAYMIFVPLAKTTDPTVFRVVDIPIVKSIYLETSDGITAFRNNDWPSSVLDICLIEIETQLFDHLLHISGKQAIDLLEHKTKYVANRNKYSSDDRANDWTWAVDGAPREGARQNKQRVLESRFDGLYVCGGAMEGRTYKTDPLILVTPPFDRDADRLQHDLGPTIDLLPNRFGGISGGGMHQVSFRGKNGIPEAIDEMFFSGVCVAGVQEKCLYSRGPSALYDIFTTYLDTLA